MSQDDLIPRPFDVTIGESQEAELRSIIRHVLDIAEQDYDIGPLLLKPILGRTGLWIPINGKLSLMGCSWAAAMLTARNADWIYPPWHGNILIDDLDWYELRAQLGADWEVHETISNQRESGMRQCTNLGIMEADRPPEQLSACAVLGNRKPLPQLFQRIDDIKHYRVLRMQGWPGCWCLDPVSHTYYRIELVATCSSFQIRILGETRPADAVQLPAQELVAQLDHDLNRLVTTLSLYQEGIVYLTLRQKGQKAVSLKNLDLR